MGIWFSIGKNARNAEIQTVKLANAVFFLDVLASIILLAVATVVNLGEALILKGVNMQCYR